MRSGHKGVTGELALFATVAIQPKGAGWAASARTAGYMLREVIKYGQLKARLRITTAFR